MREQPLQDSELAGALMAHRSPGRALSRLGGGGVRGRPVCGGPGWQGGRCGEGTVRQGSVAASVLLGGSAPGSGLGVTAGAGPDGALPVRLRLLALAAAGGVCEPQCEEMLSACKCSALIILNCLSGF